MTSQGALHVYTQRHQKAPRFTLAEETMADMGKSNQVDPEDASGGTFNHSLSTRGSLLCYFGGFLIDILQGFRFCLCSLPRFAVGSRPT